MAELIGIDRYDPYEQSRLYSDYSSATGNLELPRFTGAFAIASDLVTPENHCVSIARIPQDRRRFLAKEFFKDTYHGYVRGAIALGSFCLTAQETGSSLDGLGVVAGAGVLTLARPIRDMIQSGRRDGVMKRAMQEGMLFPGRDIRLRLSDEDLQINRIESVPTNLLIKNTKGIPGISLSNDPESREVNGSVNPGNLLDFMLKRLYKYDYDRKAQDHFLVESEAALFELSSACNSMSLETASELPSEFRVLRQEMDARLLGGTLEVCDNFLSMEAMRVADKITAFDVRSASGQLQLTSAADRLLDPDNPPSWQTIQRYDQTTPM